MQYVNQYEPSSDVLVRWVRTSTSPAGDALADRHAPPARHQHRPDPRHRLHALGGERARYADLERRRDQGHLLHADKYIRDYNDDVFLTKQTVRLCTHCKMRDGGGEPCLRTRGCSGPARRRQSTIPTIARSSKPRPPRRHDFRRNASRTPAGNLAGIHVTSFRPGHLSIRSSCRGVAGHRLPVVFLGDRRLLPHPSAASDDFLSPAGAAFRRSTSSR